jgi:hypothetical protein
MDEEEISFCILADILASKYFFAELQELIKRDALPWARRRDMEDLKLPARVAKLQVNSLDADLLDEGGCKKEHPNDESETRTEIAGIRNRMMERELHLRLLLPFAPATTSPR